MTKKIKNIPTDVEKKSMDSTIYIEKVRKFLNITLDNKSDIEQEAIELAKKNFNNSAKHLKGLVPMLQQKKA